MPSLSPSRVNACCRVHCCYPLVSKTAGSLPPGTLLPCLSPAASAVRLSLPALVIVPVPEVIAGNSHKINLLKRPAEKVSRKTRAQVRRLPLCQVAQIVRKLPRLLLFPFWNPAPPQLSAAPLRAVPLPRRCQSINGLTSWALSFLSRSFCCSPCLQVCRLLPSGVPMLSPAAVPAAPQRARRR